MIENTELFSTPDYLASSSEIAMQGSVLDPAMNSAQKGKKSSNELKDAMDSLLEIFRGSKNIDGILGLEKQDGKGLLNSTPNFNI